MIIDSEALLLESDDIRKAARQACSESPTQAELTGTQVAEPVLVRNPRDEPEFWLVPLLRDDHASGLVTLTLSGTVQRVGIFGGGAEDRQSWIPASYFLRPPLELMQQIDTNYSDAVQSEPVFSFDQVPDRWGWRIQINPPTGDFIFIGPHGWYAVPSIH